MKFISTISLIVITVFCFSFNQQHDKGYNQLYGGALAEFSQQLLALENAIIAADLSSEKEIQAIRKQIKATRLKLKGIDFWLRYAEPTVYKKINGPLPIEWENEVFEKFEPPYRREGAGLTLAELYLDKKLIIKDSLLTIVHKSIEATKAFAADSITNQLNSYHHFFLANRLFLLNLVAIYTTGFECPDTNNIIPELYSLLRDTKKIYNSYDQTFTATPLTQQYLDLYEKTILFVSEQPSNYSTFDHFVFIKDYVNPLFALNQQFIRNYRVVSINTNDYTLNNTNPSIFDKSLYLPQNSKGIYSMVEDEQVLIEIKQFGNLLFYDPILSGNNRRSCASCHKPTEYFTDTSQKTSSQFDNIQHLQRNTPTLINAIYNHLLMLDGKHISLQDQARDVITNPIEMNSNEKQLLEKVLSCKDYEVALRKFLKLTPEENKISLNHIISAITFNIGTLSRFSAPFDEAMNNRIRLGEEAKRGFNLFMSKAKCGTCHFVPNFNGVKPPYISSEFEVLGTPNDTSFTQLSPDKGRYNINPAPETMNAFRTGSLRNAQYTKPYMHNGVFNTLEEVINFYDQGGGVGKKLIAGNQTLPSDSLKLTIGEKGELITFIHSLSENIIFEDPPSALPLSSNKILNHRIVGGQY